jgi:hypothetical protein
VEGYQVYVKCDHVSPADVKMSRANEIELIDSNDYDVCGYIHICKACKAALGARFGEVAVLQNN